MHEGHRSISLNLLGGHQGASGGCGVDGGESSVLAADGTHAGEGPQVYLETFGCQMNELDSQLVISQLRAVGCGFTSDWEAADVVLYNTCSVREQAENKVLSRLGIVARHKKNHRPDLLVGVIGCMAERDGKDMLRKFPQVDLLCGPGELDKLPLLIDNLLKTAMDARGGIKGGQVALQGDTARRSSTLESAVREDKLELLDLARAFSANQAGGPDKSGGRSAYVRITRGCNKFCTYCVVPNTRGPETHRHPDHIVDECKRLVAAGALEICLLGQTVNHYHYDLAKAEKREEVWQPQVGTVISPNAGTGGPSPVFNDTTVSFAMLLRRVHDEVPGLKRLRFVTSYPRDFGDDILETIRDCPRICRYLHLPVQSGSDRVLAKMNRGHRIAAYDDLIERIHRILPDATLATDIIVGFPGETDEDFEATADLLRRCRFKNSFIFKYSPRPGTPAYDRIPDSVPNEVKRFRNNELLRIQAEVSAEVHAEWVGRTVEVLVEKASNLGEKQLAAGETRVQMAGRTGGDLVTHFEGDLSMIGELVQVNITGSQPLALSGELVA